jgi:hypothetical protein
MRRRTARHARPLELQLKLMVFPIGDRLSSPTYCAIPMAQVRQVLNKGQHLNQEFCDYSKFDLNAYAFDQPIEPQSSYTLLVESQSSRSPAIWGLQIPTLPTLVNVPEQSIKTFSSEDDLNPIRSILHRFVTLTDSEPNQTLFLLDLDRLSNLTARLPNADTVLG